jgi:hypothetical protein
MDGKRIRESSIACRKFSWGLATPIPAKERDIFGRDEYMLMRPRWEAKLPPVSKPARRGASGKSKIGGID